MQRIEGRNLWAWKLVEPRLNCSRGQRLIRLSFVGHITRDRILSGASPERIQPGGSAWYGAMVARALGADVEVSTRISAGDVDVLTGDLLDRGVTVHNRPSRLTTSFSNVYPAPGGERRQKLTAIADPLERRQIRGGVDAYVLGPLTRDDIPIQCVAAAASGRLTAIDIQGLLRPAVTGTVRFAQNAGIRDVVRVCRIVKSSREEALYASGESSVPAAVSWFLEHGAREVLVTRGSEGSTVGTQQEVVDIPVSPAGRVVDPTGCGDAYLAAYVVHRLAGSDPQSAAKAASVLAGTVASVYGVPPLTSGLMVSTSDRMTSLASDSGVAGLDTEVYQ